MFVTKSFEWVKKNETDDELSNDITYQQIIEGN